MICLRAIMTDGARCAGPIIVFQCPQFEGTKHYVMAVVIVVWYICENSVYLSQFEGMRSQARAVIGKMAGAGDRNAAFDVEFIFYKRRYNRLEQDRAK